MLKCVPGFKWVNSCHLIKLRLNFSSAVSIRNTKTLVCNTETLLCGTHATCIRIISILHTISDKFPNKNLINSVSAAIPQKFSEVWSTMSYESNLAVVSPIEYNFLRNRRLLWFSLRMVASFLKMEERASIKFFVKLGKTFTEMLEMLRKVWWWCFLMDYCSHMLGMGKKLIFSIFYR